MKNFLMKTKNIALVLLLVSIFTGSTLLTNYNGAIVYGQSEKSYNTQQIKSPKYIFYFIGDGLGASQRQLAELYLKEKTNNPQNKLMINQLETFGMNTTYSKDSLVTDSAAAGTALATGFKTNNGMISQSPSGKKFRTLIECAEEKGLSTGIITTTRLTHATPAVFASHNESRSNENDIASDFVNSGVDFFAGGGVRHFLPSGWLDYEKDPMGNTIKSKRKDDRNLLHEFEAKGYNVFYGKSGASNFKTNDFSQIDKVFAAFTYSHIPYEIDRINTTNNMPSLRTMTKKGIEVLSKNKKGFFMMVEAGRIDHACHANDATGSSLDVLALDEAVKEAYDFYQSHPKETLILVVGDHETGGLGLGFNTDYFIKMDQLMKSKVSVEDMLNYKMKYDGNRKKYFEMIDTKLGLGDLNNTEKQKLLAAMDLMDKEGNNIDTKKLGYGYYSPVAVETAHIISERANIQWTTYAHTGTAIPLSAEGVGAENFGGYKDNTEIAKTLAELLNFNLK